MRAMRNGRTAATTVVVVAFAVVLMHLGMPLMAMPSAAGSSSMHHGAPPTTAPAETTMAQAEHGTSVEKQTVDAVHDHEAHDCAGTVVVHKTVGAPPLVAVLPLADGAADATPAARAALARGPPPWTVLDLARLCVLRV
ncbi:hypothetical protein ACXYTP_04690 [Tsukamurella ocularis]|uniref:hypothetical protein n=1 Tax=Tsukamurella ocularis TaxID=1970234 RepID=UPI0039EED23D